MSLETLREFDAATASAILAATALSTGSDPELSKDEELVRQYKAEIPRLLAEIKGKLHLSSDDDSPEARARIDKFISTAIDDTLSVGGTADDALNRAGLAGRLSPAMYKVQQPDVFVRKFRDLGARKKLVEETVRYPTEFQHLLTNDAP